MTPSTKGGDGNQDKRFRPGEGKGVNLTRRSDSQESDAWAGYVKQGPKQGKDTNRWSEGDWRCPDCYSHNFRRNEECHYCRKVKLEGLGQRFCRF